MKKMTFALACASTALLFADLPNAIGFEGYTAPFTGLSLMTDAGVDASAMSSFWLYSGASGAVDGSTVKKYGSENLAKPTTGDAGDNYLELSTEGGTLWRSANNLAGAESLGAAVEVPEGGLYIDTMVQFTPTEDGGAPEIGDDDKLAIWLNVDADGNTNLCVRALQVAGGGELMVPQTFILNNADESLEIKAGEWYQLTVKANMLMATMSAFQIFVDGVPLKATGDQKPFDDGAKVLFDDPLLKDEIADDRLFPSLLGTDEANHGLQAVGFKGSGAIDNLSISATAPEFGGDVAVESVTLDQTTANLEVGGELQLTATVNPDNATDKKVTWTTSSADIATVVDGKVTAVAAGEATITATAGGKSATCTVTVTAPAKLDWDNPKTESGTAADMFDITREDLAAADGQKLAAWAKGNGSVSFDKAGDIILDAFLLNVANTEAAVNEAKPDFKIKSITVNADGTVTIEGPDGKYNGTVTIKGSATVDGEYKLPQDDVAARFFKAFLSL